MARGTRRHKNPLQETFRKGRMHKELKVGLQSLIPKLKDRNLITTYRPISVLGSTYKIVSKTLANELQFLLPLWIRPTQTSFVHDRFILNNVFLAFEAMEWVNESDQNLIMLLLNFEKTYDIISWTFLQESMRELGFSNVYYFNFYHT